MISATMNASLNGVGERRGDAGGDQRRARGQLRQQRPRQQLEQLVRVVRAGHEHDEHRDERAHQARAQFQQVRDQRAFEQLLSARPLMPAGPPGVVRRCSVAVRAVAALAPAGGWRRGWRRWLVLRRASVRSGAFEVDVRLELVRSSLLRAGRGTAAPWRAPGRPSGRRCVPASAACRGPARPAPGRRSARSRRSRCRTCATPPPAAGRPGVRRRGRTSSWLFARVRDVVELRVLRRPESAACSPGRPAAPASPSLIDFLKPRTAAPRSEPMVLQLLGAEHQQHDHQDHQQVFR